MKNDPVILTDPRAPDPGGLPTGAAASDLLQETWRQMLDAGQVASLAQSLAGVTGPAQRALALGALDRALQPQRRESPVLGGWVFCLPLLVVAAGTPGTSLPGELPDPGRLVRLLGDAGAAAPGAAVSLAPALCAPGWNDAAMLLDLHQCARALEQGAPPTVPALAPAPILLSGEGEEVHLRYLVGLALTPRAAPSVLETAANVARWGMSLGQEVAAQLATQGVTTLVLPRPPQGPMIGTQSGEIARAEIGLQLFVSAALRHYRGATGEPEVTVASLRGGAIGLCLYSVFDREPPRIHRRELAATEDFQEAARSLLDLLQECRVEQPRIVSGVLSEEELVAAGPRPH